MIKGIIGIPMGDPSGIGPEIIAKCLNDKGVYDLVKPVVIGNRRIMNRVLIDNSINLKINVAKTIEECRFNYGTVDIIEVDDHLDIDEFAYGKESAIYGKASYNYIEKATELALNDEIDAMVTPPINKVSLNMAGILDLGHTELLEKFTGRKNTLTMFQVHDLKVFFYTRHVSLKKACDLVKKEKLKRFFDQVFEGLNLLGFDEPKVVVAGLNPHCGDNGLFGNEEKKEIEPAINEYSNESCLIHGPSPADSVFYKALKGNYDAVISLYHDQGHIATKMVDFERTVSLTLGLPFLRVSVDHGTAFDIAGKGIASYISLKEAILVAKRYAGFYKKKKNL